jgi:carboxypeptidase T
MKKIILISTMLLLALWMNAQEKYSQISINLHNTSIAIIAKLGVDIDHCTHPHNGSIEFPASEFDIAQLNANGIAYTIVHADATKFYADRLVQKPTTIKKTRSAVCVGKTAPIYTTPTNFSYGSMGGYLTNAEAIAKLDSLAILYPNILKAKAPIDTFKTYEGRSIYWYKISDNPSTDENEPEIMYNALHHAREAITLAQIVYYMAYLCENYASNAEIKYIVDHTEMYFVPIVNPDGYVYNQTIAPNGGGLWRKNRRLLANNVRGVDLNRNYATGWGYNNIGSSSFTSSEVYRGPSPASEPEIKAIQWFCNHHQFQIAQNAHSFGGDWIYPWGYLEKNSDDSTFFRTMANEIDKFSFYKYGIDKETVGYSTNGASDDWQYDATVGHNKIYCGTPEIGDRADGFWPVQSRILPLCQEMNYFNLTSAKLLLPYAITNYEGSRFLNTFSSNVAFSINKIGLAPSAIYTVTIIPISTNIANVGLPKTYSTLQLADKKYDNIAITIKTGTANNSHVEFVIQCDNGIEKINDTIHTIFGNAQIVFIDSCNNMANWTGAGWGIGTGGYKSDSALMDSPNALYGQGIVDTVVSKSINLQNVLSAELRYDVKWALQNNTDVVNIYIVENGMYNQVCTKYTQPYLDANTGSLGSVEAYNGINDLWVNESIDLDAYIGKNVKVAFEINTDNNLEFDGISLDNITVNGINKVALNTSTISKNEIQFYPNPTNGSIYFNEAIASLQVYTVDGKQVFTSITNQNNFNLSALSKGLYTIRYANAKGQINNAKLIIQ